MADNIVGVPVNPKSELQEFAQSKKFPLPTYEILERNGLDHEPLFTVKVSVDKCFGIATAGNKKLAEQQAAENLLIKIKNN